MGLETRKLSSLWKDQALVAINVAVIHSYQVKCPYTFVQLKYWNANWDHLNVIVSEIIHIKNKLGKKKKPFIYLMVFMLLFCCRKIRSPSRTTIQQASPSCSTWRQKFVCVEAVQVIGCGWSHPCLAPSPLCIIRRCSTTSFLPFSIIRYQTFW